MMNLFTCYSDLHVIHYFPFWVIQNNSISTELSRNSRASKENKQEDEPGIGGFISPESTEKSDY